MNKLQYHFIFGLFLGLSIAFSLFLWEKTENKTHNNTRNFDSIKASIDKADINKGKLLLTSEIPKIEVVIKNNTNIELDTIRGHVDLYDNDGLFGSCWENFKRFKPLEERKLIIECWQFKANNLPKNTRIKSKIKYVWVQNKS